MKNEIISALKLKLKGFTVTTEVTHTHTIISYQSPNGSNKGTVTLNN